MSRSVLVVDDDPKMRELLQIVLESAGFETSAAADGESALRVFQQRKPRLVVADVVLPKVDGLELCRRILAEDEETSVILMSGVHSLSLIAPDAEKAGALCFLPKPIDLNAFVALVRDALGEKGEKSTSILDLPLERLRRDYILGFPAMMQRIREEWALVLNGKDENAVEHFHRSIHSIAGTAGTLGLKTLGDTAREVEKLLRHLMNASHQPDPQDKRKIRKFLDTMKRAFSEIPEWIGEVPLSEALEEGATQEQAETEDEIEIDWVPEEDGDEEDRPEGGILLFAEDDATRASLSSRLRLLGYELESAGDLVELKEWLDAYHFSALILDPALGDDPLAGCALLGSLEDRGTLPETLIVVSQQSDLWIRLQALRAGASSFIHHPFSVDLLAAALDRSEQKSLEHSPYRVLVVDDDASAAFLHAEILRSAGMTAVEVSEVDQVMEAAQELSPDLILMDLYLPLCSGVELAQILRQDEAMVSVPILFLSVEERDERRMEAISGGAVDFLTKPVDPALLLAHVEARARRGRELYRHGSHDGLTGLLNHSSVLDRLRSEFARSVREKEALSVVMIDIDHFKEINDRWGHLVGDRILKTVARCLSSRLRRSDHLGRYGGDEFLAVLPSTPAKDAALVMEKVRSGLESLLENLEDASVRAGLSIGVAEYSGVGKVHDLMSAADLALYQAKDAGRNRIVIAESQDESADLRGKSGRE